MLNTKHGSCECQFFEVFGLTQCGNWTALTASEAEALSTMPSDRNSDLKTVLKMALLLHHNWIWYVCKASCKFKLKEAHSMENYHMKVILNHKNTSFSILHRKAIIFSRYLLKSQIAYSLYSLSQYFLANRFSQDKSSLSSLHRNWWFSLMTSESVRSLDLLKYLYWFSTPQLHKRLQ